MNGKQPMPEDLITPENLSKELLYSIFDAAYMDVSYDSDGDLMIQDDVRCFVIPNEKTKDRIRLFTLFGFNPESSELDRLESVNRINNTYIMVRATSSNNDTLFFDYDICVKGGITRKNLVLTVKRFCSIPRDAVSEYCKGIVGST
jgi:hypothetical protein